MVLGLVVVLPSATGLERVDGQILGTDVTFRFVLYALAAAVTASLASWLLLHRPAARRAALLPGAILVWFTVSAGFAHQDAREWLPPLTRWALYGSVFVIAASAAMRPAAQATARLMFRRAVALGLVVPLVGGFAEMWAGTARTLNGAPRISAITLGHPVEFSLILVVGGLILWPLALSATTRPQIRRAVAVAAVLILIELILSYTRLSLAIALAGGTVLVVAAFPGRRVMAGLGSVVVSAMILGVASPILVARFEEPVIWPTPGSSPGSSTSPDPAATPEPTPRLVLVDNSAKLRIDTHRRGIGYIISSPIVGHGTGSFDRLYEADTGRFGVAAHDDLLLFAVEDGLPGLAIALFVYGAVAGPGLLRLRGGLRDGGFESGAAVAFLALNVVAAIHNPTYFPEVEVAVWAGVGLCWPETSDSLRSGIGRARRRLGHPTDHSPA